MAEFKYLEKQEKIIEKKKAELEDKTKNLLHESKMNRIKEKYDTLVGQRGVMLSGGQKQRLTIARALMRDASVYIFDDCLSAVDPETEQEIIKTLREEMKGSTMIIITHRLKVLQNADIIYVLIKAGYSKRATTTNYSKMKAFYAKMYKKTTRR